MLRKHSDCRYEVPDISGKAGYAFGDNQINLTSFAVFNHPDKTVAVLQGRSGDTLISGTTGRTDFPTGSLREMMKSIRRIAELPGDLKVYCGHGENSTLAAERKYNYAMRKEHDDDLSE